jgi:hypothetical protein
MTFPVNSILANKNFFSKYTQRQGPYTIAAILDMNYICRIVNYNIKRAFKRMKKRIEAFSIYRLKCFDLYPL